MRCLGCHVNREFARCTVKVCNRSFSLHGRRVISRVMHFNLGNDICLRKRFISCFLIANLPLENFIVALSGLVIANNRSTRCLRLEGVHNYRKLFVLHNNFLYGIFGDIWVVCDYRSNSLSLKANLVGCQHCFRVVRKRWHPCQVTSSQHFSG